MKHVVGVADMKIATEPGDVIVTHALGSCLGIAIHDPVASVGGLLHVMLPLSRVNPEKAKINPYMFVDVGVPAFFKQAIRHGGNKGRFIVKVAGGANVQHSSDHFAIGKRNYIMLKKLLWKNGVLIDAEDIGGDSAKTMYLEIGSGRTWLSTAGAKKDL